LSNGNIVDRKEHPEAVPMQENSLFGIPKPKKLKKHKCDYCGEEFYGNVFPVYDENYNLQEGVICCGDCFGKGVNY